MIERVRPLRWPDDRAALIEHFRHAHESDDDELLGTWYGTLPGFDPHNSFVIDGEDGAIAAHIMLIPRQLQIGISTLPTAEIALAGCLDDHNRVEMLRALLETVHERAAERGDALSLLLGPPDNGYWQAEGQGTWQYEYAIGLYLTSFESDIATEALLRAGSWDLTHSYQRRTADRLGVKHQPVTVRRFYSSDLPAVSALYSAAGARGDYVFVRDEALWTWQLDYLARIGRYEPDDFLVAEISGNVVAYARIVSQAPVNWFMESDAPSFSIVEAAGDDPDGVEALVAAIGHTARTLDADRIGLHIHPQCALMTHLLARGASLRAFTGAGMVRLNDLGEALDRLHATLELRRLNSPYAGRAYRLVVSTESDQGEVLLGAGDHELVDLEIPATSLACLITGWIGLDQVTAGYPERYGPLLRALFPQRDPRIALSDLL